MDIAKIILDYLQTLMWPGLLLLAFLKRKAIRKMFHRMPEEGSAEITGLGKYSWKRQVQDVAEKLASPAVTDANERDSTLVGGFPTLPFPRGAEFASGTAGVDHRSWDELRGLAVINPTAAVLLTWHKVEYAMYAYAYKVKATLSDDWNDHIEMTASRLGANKRTAIATAQLAKLAEHADAGVIVVPSAALVFIDAAERIATTWDGNRSSNEDAA